MNTAGPSYQNQFTTDANNIVIPTPISGVDRVVGLHYTSEIHAHYANESAHTVTSNWVAKGLLNERGF